VSTARDCWAEWLAERRFGGDPAAAEEMLAKLGETRDRVLEHAGVAPGETVLDVGCGDGLIAFGALDLVGPDGEVIFSDVSEDLLAECRRRASDRSRFVLASADDLSPIEDGSVDVVTTRSVLIYVKDKERAFAEFARVLRPCGRISLFEPINRFSQGWSYDFSSLPEIAAKLDAVYNAIQPPDADPMLDFDERDLIRLAEGAGFFPVELEYRAEVRPVEPRSWQTFLRTAGNPRIPTLEEAIDQALSPKERERLTTLLRPLVEQGRGTWRMGQAFLRAVKP
jgi:arsenite methyltransferase